MYPTHDYADFEAKMEWENARLQSDRDLAYSSDVAYCECKTIHAEEEFHWNECAACGKAIAP